MLLSRAGLAHRSFAPREVLELDSRGGLACLILSGAVSRLVVASDGFQLETVLAGPGDWIGWPRPEQNTRHMWAAAGEAALVSLPRLIKEAVSEGLGEPLLDDLAAPMLERLQVALTCRARHSITERLARRLLDLSRFCGETATVSMTQDDAASALGVQRTSVTHASVKLQATGAISVRRGRAIIRDRQRLNSLACHCSLGEGERDFAPPAKVLLKAMQAVER